MPMQKVGISSLVGGRSSREYDHYQEKDSWSRTTKVAVAVILLLAAAYSAHRYGLIDLSKLAGAVGNILSRGVDYGKSAYHFIASYTPDPVEQGVYYGLALASTCITASCIVRIACLVIDCERTSVSVQMPNLHLKELSLDLGHVRIDFR